MQKHLSPDQLARDDRFVRVSLEERFRDPRAGSGEERKLDRSAEDVPEAAWMFS